MSEQQGGRNNGGVACRWDMGLRARMRAQSWSARLESGETAPASVLWIFGWCIDHSDLPDLRRWLVRTAFDHWVAGRSLSSVAEDPGKRQWFERAVVVLGPDGDAHAVEAVRALVAGLEAQYPGLTGRRSIHGAPRRRVPDPDLLLINDVCNEVLSERRRASVARLIEWNALAFCITNIDLRWQLTPESAPRLRELADWFATRAADHDANCLALDIAKLLD